MRLISRLIISSLVGLFLLIPLGTLKQPTSPSDATTRIGYGVNGGWDRLDVVKDMGFTWVKLTVSWKQYAPSRGTYTIADLDSTIQRATSRGMKVLLRVDDTPDWASSRPGAFNAPPINDTDLGDFLFALAFRFRGQVQAYELYNETNLNYEWGMFDPDPNRYGQMLKAIYPRIKQADVNALVVSGGLSTAGDGTSGPYLGDLYYLAKLFDPNQDGDPSDGYGAYLDAVGTHPYGGPYTPATPPSVAQFDVGTYFRRAEQQHDMVLQWGKVDKPLWATEFGWLLDPAGLGLSCNLGEHFDKLKVSAQFQADSLVGAYQYAVANWPWMGPMFLFNFDMAMDSWRAQCEQVRFFSILKADGNPLPAYTALKNMQKSEAPWLAAPAPGSLLTTLGTALSWSLPTGATQYQLQVVPPNNDGPGINLIRNTETNYTVQPPMLGQGNYVMLPGMTYSWRLRATSKLTFAPEDDPAWGPWSEWRTFRTPAPSSATISPVFPASGSTVESTVPIGLRWSNSASDIFYYEVQTSPDPNFGEQGAVASVWHNLVHGGVTNPLNSWLTPQLQPQTTYYWRARPRVQGDGTPVAWSATWSFRTP